jgi:hypothetical protein
VGKSVIARQLRSVEEFRVVSTPPQATIPRPAPRTRRALASRLRPTFPVDRSCPRGAAARCDASADWWVLEVGGDQNLCAGDY